MFTLAELNIKIKAPRYWTNAQCDVFYSYMTEKIQQIAAYARSIDLEHPELVMKFESSELPASFTKEIK